MKPVLIDAAAALRILMPPDDKKADPHREADCIEFRTRNGYLCSWGLRDGATVPEAIPAEHACTLKFDWHARASEVDDQLGQLDLWGFNDKPAWRNVRFYRHEIEATRQLTLLLLLVLVLRAVPPRGEARS